MDLEYLKSIVPDSMDWLEAKKIDFGWSGEEKFCIKTSTDSRLLRLLSFEQYEEQKQGIDFLEKVSAITDRVPHVYSKGDTLDGKYYYLLLDYFLGSDGMHVIHNYSIDEQYDLGYQMGGIIKKLHNMSTPKIVKAETDRFREKIKSYLDYFSNTDGKYEFLEESIDIIRDFESILDSRPVVMIHNDFHLGNMIINNKDIYLIDFNRATLGDSIKEFDGIAWSVKYSKYFATGLLDSYLVDMDKDEFFKILRGYMAIWQLQMLKFIENEPEEEKIEVLDLIKFTISWFEEGVVPNWYIKNTKN